MPLVESAAPRFQPYDPSHLWAIGLTVVLAFALIRLVRRRPASPHIPRIEKAFAVLFLLVHPLNLFFWARDGALDPHTAYPLHLCNFTAFVIAYVLFTQNRAGAALCYFWALGGATQGLFTPALDAGFPRGSFLIFFFLHGGLIAVSIYLVFGRRLVPRYRDIWIAGGWMLVYLAVVYPLNRLLGTNYGFLVHKPPTGSLLDVLGPWPVYIAGILGVALLAFHLFYLPTLFLKSVRGRR